MFKEDLFIAFVLSQLHCEVELRHEDEVPLVGASGQIYGAGLRVRGAKGEGGAKRIYVSVPWTHLMASEKPPQGKSYGVGSATPGGAMDRDRLRAFLTSSAIPASMWPSWCVAA